MFEEEFVDMLKAYRDVLGSRRRFVGLAKDYFPGQSRNINLLTAAYDLGIHMEIEQAEKLTKAFSYRYVKRLVEEYGISRKNADWAVAAWCVCYGRAILHKGCDVNFGKKSGRDDLPVRNAPAGQLEDSDFFRYRERGEDGEFAVAGYDGDADAIVLQNSYKNDLVTEVYAGAFAESELTEVTIAEGYLSVGDRAFWGCKQLRRVRFPASLRELGDYAFEGCDNLEAAVIPPMVDQIGSYAFAGTKIKSILIPGTAYWLGEGMFFHCRSLAHVSFPKDLNWLPDRMFAGCSVLNAVELPEKLAEIGESAFEGCIGLEEISIPGSVERIGRDAFSGMNQEFIFRCSAGSYAEEYAKQNRLNCVAL